MKKWIKAVLSGAVAVALTVGMLAGLTRLVERKYARIKYEPFFEQEEDFDVLFCGTSHVINGVFPMELWEDYGIVSYNFGGYANTLPTTYWVLKNAMRYTKPKLVMIDSLRMSSPTPVYAGVDFLHNSFDAFPLTMDKVEAVCDLTKDWAERAQLLFDFSAYHNRWKEINMGDLMPNVSPEKGAESLIGVTEWGPPARTEKVLEENTLGEQYLRKAIELCQEQGIDVILTFLPFCASETEQMEANRVSEIAKMYGVPYINFLDMDIVDFGMDTFDGGHLNPSGARKVTDYLGQYIRENYDIPDRRDDPDYAGWYEDYKVYTDFKVSNLAGQTDIKNYLMLLQDKHFSDVLYLTPHEAWAVRKKNLLNNIGVDSGQLRADGPTQAVADHKAGTVLYLALGEETDTSFGHLAFVQGEGTYQVLLNGAVQLELTNQTMAAAVVDGATDQVVTTAQFTSSTATTFTRAA